MSNKNHPESGEYKTDDHKSTLRAIARLTAFALFTLVSLPFLLLGNALRLKGARKMPRPYHAICSKIFGLKIRVHGKMIGGSYDEEPTFFVSSHSSYFDIPALGSIIEGSFVAKADISSWPFIGKMCEFQNTVFIERRAIRAGKQVKILHDRLDTNDSLIVFPEGTSTDGTHVLPFKSSLFSAVEEKMADGKPVRVQPVSTTCSIIGDTPVREEFRHYFAWYGDMELASHAWEAFKLKGFTIDIIFHPSVTIDDFNSRKELAEHCQKAVAGGVNKALALEIAASS